MLRHLITALLLISVSFVLVGCQTTESSVKNEIETLSQNERVGAHSYILKGARYAHEKDYLAAKLYYLKAAELTPKDPDIWRSAAQAAIKTSDFDEAETYLMKVVALNSSDLMIYQALAILHGQQQQYDKVIWALNQSLQIAPNDWKSFAGLARAYRKTNQNTQCLKAIQQFESALEQEDFDQLSEKSKRWIEHRKQDFADFRHAIAKEAKD